MKPTKKAAVKKTRDVKQKSAASRKKSSKAAKPSRQAVEEVSASDDDGDLQEDVDSAEEMDETHDEEIGDEDYGSFQRHQDELENLKKTDPEFYKYLQENDEGLLQFGGDDSDEESLEQEIADTTHDREEDLSEEEDAEGEAEEDAESEEQTQKRRKKARKVVAQEVTRELLEQVAQGAMRGSLADLKRLIAMFRAASQPLMAEDNEQEDEPRVSLYSISSAEVYEAVMTRAIDTIHRALALHLELRAPLSKNKLDALSSHKRWKKLQMIVLIFFKLVLQNLQAVGLHAQHSKVTIFLLDSIEHYIPFVAPLPRLKKTLLKMLLGLWAGPLNDGEDQAQLQLVRGHSFLRIRQMALQLPGTMAEECFRLIYLKYARRCKSFSEANMGSVVYLANCVAELYSLDAALAYQQAFLYIRQLALHLRTAFVKKGEAAMKSIRCWQFVNCVRLWTKVLSQMPSSETGLGVLCFPLAQVMLGVMALLPSPYYSPLRFQLVGFLQTLAAHCEVFAPAGHHLCEVLEYADLFSKPSPSTDLPPVLSCLLSFPANSLTKPQTRDALVAECIHLLRMEIEIYRYNAGFPEYVHLIARKLKAFAKKTKQAKWRESARALVSQIQQMSAFVKNERTKQSLSPTTALAFEALLPANTPACAERVTKLLANRSKLLSVAAKDRPVQPKAAHAPRDEAESESSAEEEEEETDEQASSEEEESDAQEEEENNDDGLEDRVEALNWN